MLIHLWEIQYSTQFALVLSLFRFNEQSPVSFLRKTDLMLSLAFEASPFPYQHVMSASEPQLHLHCSPAAWWAQALHCPWLDCSGTCSVIHINWIFWHPTDVIFPPILTWHQLKQWTSLVHVYFLGWKSAKIGVRQNIFSPSQTFHRVVARLLRT